MKGVIIKCLGELVFENFGTETWEDILEHAGLDRKSTFGIIDTVDDKIVLTIVESACTTLGITPVKAAHLFGKFWINSFAPKHYAEHFYNAHSALDFLSKMDYVHEIVKNTEPGANPPQFEYEWTDDKTLIMTYKSERGLIDFFVGIIKGVGTYYREDLKVTKLGNDRVEIIFS